MGFAIASLNPYYFHTMKTAISMKIALSILFPTKIHFHSKDFENINNFQWISVK
jgi:hypothetical protein